MSTYLDIENWPRRDAFEYFRRFDKPYFNVCVRLDVAPMQAAARAAGQRFSLALHFLVLREANRYEPFRYRLEQGRVRVHDEVHGATTVLRSDDSFGFAYLKHEASFERFAAAAAAEIDRAKQVRMPFEPRVDDTALIHFTTLPWVAFSSFSHARNWGREDSIPKIAFGRIDADGEHRWLPMSVEVHHALMDGLHLGRFVLGIEAALRDPALLLGGR